MKLIDKMKKASPAAKKALEAPSRVDNKDDKKVNELTIADVNKATEKAKKRQAKERETTGKSSVSSTDLAARMPRKEDVRSADKKAEKYRKPDGTMGVRMVPMDKTVMTSELNKSTLGSYVKKATDQLEKGKIKNVNKIGSRAVGIDTATDKMRKKSKVTNTIKASKDQEVETQTQESNLNELSPKTMGRYVGAASTSLKTAAQKSGSGSYATQAARKDRYKDLKTATKRKQGIDMAAKKLSKESVQEASKEGAIKIIKNKDNMAQVQRMTKGKFVNHGKPYKSAKDAEKVRSSGQHSMQFSHTEGAMKRLSTGDGMDTFKKKPSRSFDARAIMKKAKAQGAKPDQTSGILRRNSPAHKAAVKQHIARMKSNRPASRPTSEMSDMEKTRQMATTGDKPKPKTSTNKKPPSEMMPEAKDPAIDRLKILVRQGMMDKKDLPKIVRSLEKVKAGKEVAPADRKILFSLMGELLGMITGDEQMFQKARKKVREDAEPVNELVQLAPAAMAIGNAAVRMAPAAGAAVQTVKKAVKKVMGKEGKAYGPTGVSYSDEPNLQVKSVGDGIKKGKTIKGIIQPPKKVGMKKKPFDAPVPMNPAKNEAMGARMHRMKMVDRINKSLAKQRNNPDEKDRDIQKINKSLEKQRQQKS